METGGAGSLGLLVRSVWWLARVAFGGAVGGTLQYEGLVPILAAVSERCAAVVKLCGSGANRDKEDRRAGKWITVPPSDSCCYCLSLRFVWLLIQNAGNQ
jgi:hypothetical protein